MKTIEKIIGIIKIVYGITEHMDCYEELAKYFCKKGFLVFGINVTGHGKSLYAGKIKGYFGNEGSWQSVVENVYQSYLLIKKQYANIPYYLIGFSMESFIVRTLLIKKDNELKINGCFLLGTGYQPPFLLKIIKIIVKSNCKKVGEQNSSKLIDSLTFDNYNKKFKPIETNIDWLLKNKIE